MGSGGDIMVGAIDPKLSGLGPNTGPGHYTVLEEHITLTVPLFSSQVCKGLLKNETLIMVTLNRLEFHSGGTTTSLSHFVL